MRLIDASEIKRKADCYPKQIRDVVANILRHTKSVDAEPVKHAKDIYYEEKNWHCEFKCSLCKATIGVVEAGDLDGANFKYCPNCGARLDLEEVSDELVRKEMPAQ